MRSLAVLQAQAAHSRITNSSLWEETGRSIQRARIHNRARARRATIHRESARWTDEGSFMGAFGIGQPLSRFEDGRLLRGGGMYVADRALPGQVYACFLRSPHAHAAIEAIELENARNAAGVVGVFVSSDLAADGLGRTAVTLKRSRPDGSPMFWRAHPGLAEIRVRHVGDPVAMVVAESLDQAKDAMEQIEVSYAPMPASRRANSRSRRLRRPFGMN